MKASVAMATYNGEKYIQDQLESIMSQTVLPYEIVISDDGSTDQTMIIVNEFVEQYRDFPTRIKIFHNTDGNHGVVGNFENAFCHITGDVVFLCDQDDIWYKNKIERVLEVMKSRDEAVIIHDARVLQQQNDGEFAVTNRTLMMWQESDFDSCGVLKIRKDKYIFGAFNSFLIQGMCMCVRREFLKKILPISRGYNHDEWINFCATYEDSYIALKDELSYYRIHQNNTCGINELKQKRKLIDKIKSFDEKGKQSIIHQYVWFKDTFEFSGEVNIPEIIQMYDFFVKDRIAILRENVWMSLIHLLQKYYEGVYRNVGSIVFIHDLWFAIRYSSKKRKQFMVQLDSQIRNKYSFLDEDNP